MKNNIDEATAWGSAPNRPEEPGVGSIIKSRKKVPTEVTPATALNQRLRSKKGLPNDPSVYRTDKPKPQISKTPKGGTTFYSVAPERKEVKPEASPTEKPETKQAPKPPTTVGSKPISIPNSTQSQRKDRKLYLLQQKEKRKSGIQNKPESKKMTPDEVSIINAAFPRGSRKKPIDLTYKGKKLKPGGKAANTKISTARREGSQTRIARGKARREIIKEFIDNYRKSIL